MSAVEPATPVLLAAGVAYLLADHRRIGARRRAGRRRWWMYAALGTLALALVSPLDGAAGERVAWHMVQHVLLVAVAAPMIVLARPLETMPWLLGSRQRRAATAAGRHLTRWSRAHSSVSFVALLAAVVTMWAFHVPVVYDAAVASEWLHTLEHVALLLTATAVWWTLIGTSHRARYGSAVITVFCWALSSTALGALLVSAREPLYELGSGSLDTAQRLQDQQVAGVIMWSFGGVVTAATAVGLFAAWLSAAERRTDHPLGTPVPRHAGMPTDGRTRVERTRALLPLAPIAAVLAVLAVGLTDGSGPSDSAPAPTQSADADAVYERDCAECHGPDGRGTANGPPLAGVTAAEVDYVVSSGRMPIEDPDDEVERGPSMYDRSTEVALSQFVAALGAPGDREVPIPDVDIAAGDVSEGGELYRLNCAACHQSVGAGGALIERAAPPLDSANAVQIAEAIRVGPFEMPAFGEAALSDEEVVDVTAYVVSVIQDPEDRGGWPIWHLGPVPEGAVAIIVGLGSLVLAARWIEGRTST